MDNEKRLLVKISELYYEQGLTQNQIAKELNLSRIKVSRSLKKALDFGIVTITINHEGIFSQLENTLLDKYNLNDIVIVESDGNNYKDKVAEAAGYYLSQYIDDGDIITVGWGDTLRRTINFCQGDLSNDTIFSPIIGGHSSHFFSLHSNTISAELANKFKAKAVSLLAPAFVSSEDNRDIYIQEDYIQEVLNISKKANKAIFSVGSPQHRESTIIQTGYFKDEELDRIKTNGAICDIASIVFLNEDAESILTDITNRSIGLTHSELKAIPNKICIAGGYYKHRSIKAALQAGLIDTLITDISTAEFLSK